MRHGNKVNALSRKYGHRRALLANLATALITHKRIRTTTAKAKALRSYVEPLINRSKENSTHSRRMVFRYLQDKAAVKELFEEVGAKVANRPGGYTRILKLGNRPGDNAEMCYIELVDYNENMLKEAKTKTRRSRRRRGGKGGSAAADTATATATKATDAAADAADAVAESAAEAKEAATGAADVVADAAESAVDDAADAAGEGEETEEKA